MTAHGGLYTPGVDGSLTAEPSPQSSPPRVTQQDCLCREGAGPESGGNNRRPRCVFSLECHSDTAVVSEETMCPVSGCTARQVWDGRGRKG